MSSWGQLGYTSSKGGFGIHAETAVTVHERDVLVAGAYAGRDSFGQELPLLADPEEIDQFYRNLSYRRVDDVGACYWHSAPAGPDESGRTGNCFVHALVEKRPPGYPTGEGMPGWRPIELWRSPTAVSPFGIAAVKEATLPPLPPAPGPTATREQVTSFLTSFEVDRLSTFFQLVRACAEPRRTPLILGVGTPDEGALWIAGLSYLLSPAAGRELSFSVWEAPELLSGDRLPELEVICVEESRIPPTLADLGLQILSASQPQAVEPVDPDDLSAVFAELSLQLFSLSPEQIVDHLRQIDEVSAAVHPDPAERIWPLAMVMAGSLEQWPHLDDSITRVLQQVTPSRIEQSRHFWNLTEGLIKARIRRSRTDLADLWKDVQSAAEGPVRAMLHQAYVELAALDPAWYAVPGHRRGSSEGATRLSGDETSPWFRAALEATTPAAEDMGHDEPVITAVNLTWLIDFLLSRGWSPTPGWLTRLEQVERYPDEASDSEADAAIPFRIMGELLADPALAQAYLNRLGEVSEDCRELVVRPRVELILAKAAEHGSRAEVLLSPSLLEWLAPREPLASGHAEVDLSDPVTVEALACYLDGEEGGRWVPAVVRGLTSKAGRAPLRSGQRLLDLLAQHHVTGEEMALLLHTWAGAVPTSAVCRSLALVKAEELPDLAYELRRASSLGHRSSDIGYAQSFLAPLALDPVDYLRTNRGRITEGSEKGLTGLRMLGAWGETSSGRARLSEAWAPHFDLLIWGTDPTDWETRRAELFGAGVPVAPSARLISDVVHPRDHWEDRAFHVRRELTDRLVFNAWFASRWPERVEQGTRQRGSALRTHIVNAVENYLRGLPERDLADRLVVLLERVERGVPDEPSLPEVMSDKDIHAWLRSAEDWFNKAAGVSSFHKLGAMVKGFGRKR